MSNNTLNSSKLAVLNLISTYRIPQRYLIRSTRFLMLILLLSCFFAAPMFAQNGVTFTGGARGLAMGGATVALTGTEAAFGNQAGLTGLTTFSAMAAAERRFDLAELNGLSAAAVMPLKSAGTFGLTMHYFGFEQYNEQKIGLAYARKLFDKLSLGAQIDYLNTRIPEYGTKGIVTFEIGLQSQLNKTLRIGAHLFSPIQQDVAEDEPLPTVLRIGVAYLPSEKVTLSAEVQKDIDFTARVRAGVEYRIAEPLSLRAGIATNPSTASFGIGLHLKEKIKVDVASAWHPVLGFTPGFGLRYNLVE